jgi:hypothetical protein
MTEHSPISPPPELVQQWLNEFCDAPTATKRWLTHFVATRAAAWGADTELEACCEWLESEPDPGHVDLLRSCATALRAARRPKPLSLKEQALQELDKVDMLWVTEEFSQETLNSLDTIRRAIESIPNPS